METSLTASSGASVVGEFFCSPKVHLGKQKKPESRTECSLKHRRHHNVRPPVPFLDALHTMPRSRYRVLQSKAPHFLTATANHWLSLFARPRVVNIVLDRWRFLQRDSNFQLHGYVILENHPHLIAAAPDLTRDMQRFKAHVAKEIVAHLRRRRSERVLALPSMLKRPHKTTRKTVRDKARPDNRRGLDFFERNPR